jgi:methyltransferase-like protein 6
MSESPVEKPSRNDGARKEMDSENLEKHIARAQEVIASDKKEVPPFWINKYKKEAARNWDLFYKRNTTKFFKGKKTSLPYT